jgi:hypothetical protein
MSWYLYMKALEIIMKRNFKQRCLTIPLISEKRRINPISPQIIAHDIYQWNYCRKRNKDCLAFAHVFTPVYLVRSVLLIFLIFHVVFFVLFVFVLCPVHNVSHVFGSSILDCSSGSSNVYLLDEYCPWKLPYWMAIIIFWKIKLRIPVQI